MKTILRTVCLLFWLLLPMTGLAGKLLLSNLSVQNTLDKTRLIFEVKGDFDYKSFVLTRPDRLVIDFMNTQTTKSFAGLSLANTPITNIRQGPHNDAYRVVFDLSSKSVINVTQPKEHPVGEHQLVVEIAKPVHVLETNMPVRAKPPAPREESVAVKEADSQDQLNTKRNIVVVIDPGHGGKDPGAEGIAGNTEKDVVLTIARKLQAEINRVPGFNAVLTRKGDYYIGLRERLVLAHKYKADMFVAIHADAYLHNRAHGASVYALSERGATSEAARWLAKKENESEFVGGLDLNDKDYLVRSVLIDLSQTHTICVSLQMGSDILYELAKFATLHHSGVEQAAFVVLKSPDIPSLLVETGFLSNAFEERNLTNPYYQDKIALAVKGGIINYFMVHPPRGTEVAYLKRNGSRDT